MYRAQSADTPEAVDRLQMELLRALTPAQRLEKALALTEMALTLARAGLQRRFPSATDEELRWRLAAQHMPADQLDRIVPAHLREAVGLPRA